MVQDDLGSLRIDRSKKIRTRGSSPAWLRLLIILAVLGALSGAAGFIFGKLNAPLLVDVVRVKAPEAAAEAGQVIVLNATGYIIAAHKIQLASKVNGKVSWIGVEKGDRVEQGQVLVRLEDEEYRAHLLEARGQLDNLKAKLAELKNGSRPEEVARAKADLAQARADLANAKITLDRTRQLVHDKISAQQLLDDAQSRYDAAAEKVNSLEKAYELVRLGPRREQIDAAQAQVEQLQGTVDYAQTQLDNTVIKAPITGTILERNVEKGEFVTTGFVGDKGAKGYVVSMADLNDLQVELDINQNDFAKLGPKQKGVITTDAYPDRKYDGAIQEIAPEANRQKATVQVKVKVLRPDEYLRPEMNATVAFVADTTRSGGTMTRNVITVPADTIRGGNVYVFVDGKAVKRAVAVGGTTAQGVLVRQGLIGGEDLIANPPPDLKDGQRVRVKGQGA